MKDCDLIDDDMFPPDWEMDGDDIIVRDAEWRGNKMSEFDKEAFTAEMEKFFEQEPA